MKQRTPLAEIGLSFVFALITLATLFVVPDDFLLGNGRRMHTGDIFRGLVEVVGTGFARCLLALPSALLAWFLLRRAFKDGETNGEK